MVDLSPLASFLIACISVLGFAHAYHPWGRHPLAQGHHGKWAVVFAACVAGCLAVTCTWIWTVEQAAYVILIESPWIYGLIIEVYIFWQIFGFFRTGNGVWKHHRWYIGIAAVIAIALQLCGLHAPERWPKAVKTLAFVGSPAFHASITGAFAFDYYKYGATRARKFRLISFSFAIVTGFNIGLSVVFYFFSNLPVFCLVNSTLEFLLLSILLGIRMATDSNPPSPMPRGVLQSQSLDTDCPSWTSRQDDIETENEQNWVSDVLNWRTRR